MSQLKKTWTLYIIECADGSLYTGITNNLVRRMAAHECGKGAKYTRGRAPLKLVYKQNFKDRSAASVREAEIKTLSRQEKLAIILNF
jgi:putative endonuclease